MFEWLKKRTVALVIRGHKRIFFHSLGYFFYTWEDYGSDTIVTSGKWVGSVSFWMFKVSAFWLCFALSTEQIGSHLVIHGPLFYLPQKETSALNTWPETPPFPSLSFRENSVLTGNRNLLVSLFLAWLYSPLPIMKYSSHHWMFMSTFSICDIIVVSLYLIYFPKHDLKPADKLLCTFIWSHDFQVLHLHEIPSSQFCSKLYL